MRKRILAVGRRPGTHRAFARRAALAALLAAAAVASPGEAVLPGGYPAGSPALAPEPAAAVEAEAGLATGAEVLPDGWPAASLTAPDGAAPSALLAAAPPSLEFVTEREAPSARMRARGERCLCRATLPRRPLKPDAPRIRLLELTHRSFQAVLVAARAGVLSARSTVVPPPSASI